MKIDFYRHALTAEDSAAVADVLRTPYLTSGSVCRAVEEQISRYFGVPHAVLCNSWTNGALALLLALDLDRDAEVIVPANTFLATANVVEITGVRVVFADVDPQTLLLRPEDVAPLVSARTAVVMPVHLYGQMCDVAGLRAMLDRHPAAASRIAIVEDAAHCFEGDRGGMKPGHVGDAAVFSFYATKNITCGEGGAVVVKDAGLFDKLRQTRLHGMSAAASDRFAGGRYNAWDMLRLGVKANLPDLLAALLPRQIDAIDALLVSRQALAARYRRAFAGTGLRLVRQLDDVNSAEHIFPIGVPGGRRDEAIAALNAAGIPVTVNYRCVPGTTYYRTRYGDLTAHCPVSTAWGEETLTLPLYPTLSYVEQDYIIEAVIEKVVPMVRHG